MENIKEELKKVVAGDVADTPTEIDIHSHDASLFEVKPRVVVFPKNVEDLKHLVTFANDHDGVALSVRAAGTGMDGGALTESVSIDSTKYLNHVSDAQDYTDPTNPVIKGSIKTQPGAYYRDFEKKTLARDLLMPSYPASRELCSVGGIISNNSGGELTLRYGKTEDYIRSLKVIFADGNEYEVRPLSMDELNAKMAQGDFEGDLYKKVFELVSNNYDLLQNAKPKVSKNSAGYYLWNVYDKEKGVFDLTKLITGSQGTLGIVTEVDFKLIRPLKHSQMMVLFLDDLSRLGDLTLEVLKHNPTTFESYDDKTLRLAVKFAFELMKKLGIKNLFTLAWNGIPEAWSIIRKGFPKLVLQITFDGDDPVELEKKAQQLAIDLQDYSPRYLEVIKNPQEAKEYWLIRRESFNLLRHKTKGKNAAAFIDDIIVPPACLPEFFPKLNAILDQYKQYMIYNIAGHIGNGNFHIIPLMDLSLPEVRKIIPEIAEKVYTLVFEYGGSMTGEHNDGIMRTPFLPQQYGVEVCRLFRELKEIFDPREIFNPGKKTAGTLEYAASKLKTHN